jgi:hypothetical protein
MIDDKKVPCDTVDGVSYPVEQSDNRVREEDGDQSDAQAEVDFGDGEED